MFNINRQADYGLLLVTALATHYQQGFISLKEIAHERRLPYRFLSKIIVPLRKAGLIDSHEGVSGGYRLARSPHSITVRQVLEALGEDLMLVRCGAEDKACQSFCQCNARGFWDELQKTINHFLDAYTLSDLVKKSSPQITPNVFFKHRLIAHV